MIIEFVLFLLMYNDCFLTLYIVHISFYGIWTDMSNKLFVIVIVIVIEKHKCGTHKGNSTVHLMIL